MWLWLCMWVCHQSQNQIKQKYSLAVEVHRVRNVMLVCTESKIRAAPAKKVSIDPHYEANNETFPRY